MAPTSVTIAAPSAEAARDQGARELGVQAEQVTVEPSGESAYTVALKSAVGHLDVTVSEDRMTAQIDVITPAVGEGKPVTVAAIEDVLAEHKVTFGIDKEAIEQIIAEVAGTGVARKNVLVAAGDRPAPISRPR